MLQPDVFFGLATRFRAPHIPNPKPNSQQADHARGADHHAGRHRRDIVIEEGQHDQRGEQDANHRSSDRRALPVQSHRSLSPNTGSSAERTAVVSASMWPRIIMSSAWRWLNMVG